MDPRIEMWFSKIKDRITQGRLQRAESILHLLLSDPLLNEIRREKVMTR